MKKYEGFDIFSDCNANEGIGLRAPKRSLVKNKEEVEMANYLLLFVLENNEIKSDTIAAPQYAHQVCIIHYH